MITEEFAKQFAHEWVSAWNAHDLNAVLLHYEDSFSIDVNAKGALPHIFAPTCCGSEAVSRVVCSVNSKSSRGIFSVNEAKSVADMCRTPRVLTRRRFHIMPNICLRNPDDYEGFGIKKRRAVV